MPERSQENSTRPTTKAIMAMGQQAMPPVRLALVLSLVGVGVLVGAGVPAAFTCVPILGGVIMLPGAGYEVGRTGGTSTDAGTGVNVGVLVGVIVGVAVGQPPPSARAETGRLRARQTLSIKNASVRFMA